MHGVSYIHFSMQYLKSFVQWYNIITIGATRRVKDAGGALVTKLTPLQKQMREEQSNRLNHVQWVTNSLKLSLLENVELITDIR